jgi:hypothetical protein
VAVVAVVIAALLEALSHVQGVLAVALVLMAARWPVEQAGKVIMEAHQIQAAVVVLVVRVAETQEALVLLHQSQELQSQGLAAVVAVLSILLSFQVALVVVVREEPILLPP